MKTITSVCLFPHNRASHYQGEGGQPKSVGLVSQQPQFFKQKSLTLLQELLNVASNNFWEGGRGLVFGSWTPVKCGCLSGLVI